MKLIRDGLSGKDVNKAIHCIWYCINVGSNRTFDNSELEWLKSFTAENRSTRVPVFIVLTQGCPRKKAEEMRRLVEAENLEISKVIPVLAQDMDFDEEYVAHAYGLDTLISVMGEELPEELQDTLQNVQRVSLRSKKKRAQAAVAAAVTAAFGKGFAPVPFADAAMLIPTQITMIATITAIFGLDINKSILTSFVTSALGTGGATVLGRTAATNLLGLVPGAGTVAGGVISGATAGLITTALGEAYIALMEQLWLGQLAPEDLTGEEGRRRLLSLFREKSQKRKNSRRITQNKQKPAAIAPYSRFLLGCLCLGKLHPRPSPWGGVLGGLRWPYWGPPQIFKAFLAYRELPHPAAFGFPVHRPELSDRTDDLPAAYSA